MPTRRMLLRAFCLLAVIAASAVAAYGQSYQGGLRGAVRDAAGALVPGANMTLLNEETSVTRTTVSNDVGEYAFSNVFPGTYTLTAARSGFKRSENKGIHIGTQTFITLDLTLEIGQVTEQRSKSTRLNSSHIQKSRMPSSA